MSQIKLAHYEIFQSVYKAVAQVAGAEIRVHVFDHVLYWPVVNRVWLPFAARL